MSFVLVFLVLLAKKLKIEGIKQKSTDARCSSSRMTSEQKTQTQKDIALWDDSAHYHDWSALMKKDYVAFEARIKFLIQTERINILLRIIDINPICVFMAIAEFGRCDILERAIEECNRRNLKVNFVWTAIAAATNGQLGIIMRLKEITVFERSTLIAMYQNASKYAESKEKEHADLKEKCIGVLGALRGWYLGIEKWVYE